MNLDADSWKAKILILLIKELEVPNKRAFTMIKNLKILHDKSQGLFDDRDLPAKFSLMTENSAVFFRGRGTNAECELCGNVISGNFLGYHLKSCHDLAVNYNYKSYL